MKMLATLMALGLGLCLAGISSAADDKNKDQEFAQKASACGLAEVNLGNLAARTSTNPAVQQFAQRMAQDHMRSNQQLIQIANQQGLKLASTMDKKHQTLMTDLTKATGEQFDRRFVQHQLEDHEQAIKCFEEEAKNGKDPALKQFASNMLPILREHQKMAKGLASKLGISEKGEKGNDRGGDRDRK
jgi:putative membrane protein